MTGRYAKPDGTNVVADPEHFEGVLSDEPAKQKAVKRRPISHLEAMRIARAHRNADIEAELEGERELSRQRANSIQRLRHELSQANHKLEAMSRLQVGTLGTLVAAAIRESAQDDFMPMVLRAIKASMKLGDGDVVTIQCSASDLRWAVPTRLRDDILACVARHGNAGALFDIKSVEGHIVKVRVSVPELFREIPVSVAHEAVYRGENRYDTPRPAPPRRQTVGGFVVGFEPRPDEEGAP